MKKILAAGMILASVSAFAYSGASHHMSRMSHLPYEQLDLTPEQMQQIKKIRKESRDERIKLMDQMQDLKDDTRMRMMAVLTPEQKKELKTLRREMHLNCTACAPKNTRTACAPKSNRACPPTQRDRFSPTQYQ